MKADIEINKLKIVLLALWDNEPHPEALNLITEFRHDIANLRRG